MDRSDKYYGIYRGIIVNTGDPENRGRVTLKVPQVSGEQETGWAWPIQLNFLSSVVPYGVFTRNTNQSYTLGQVKLIDFDYVEESAGGVALDPNDSSKICVPKAGTYQILFSPQFSNGNSSTVQADIWLRVNGEDVPRTNSRVTLQGNPNEIVITVPFIISLEEDDYIQIAWEADHSTVFLSAYSGLTSPTRPNIPSVIASVNYLGLPSAETGSYCWVMFEGGDPNFPLWLGVH